MLARNLKQGFAFVKATLPTLEYGYNDLAPVITAEIMEVHHGKHHNAYVNNYNAAVEKFLDFEAKGNHHAASDLCKAIRFNGGGHVNHAIYWENLAPASRQGGSLPNKDSAISKAIVDSWGSYDNFIKDFNGRTAAIQGSGWGWLAYRPETKKLSIEETPNQEIISASGYKPLLVIDVWEHAYYLQYKNLRPDYLKRIWEIVNWKTVEKRFDEATK